MAYSTTHPSGRRNLATRQGAAPAVSGDDAFSPETATAALPGEPVVDEFEARWDEERDGWRVWNVTRAVWAQRPTFRSERVARTVADSMAHPGGKHPKSASAAKSAKRAK